MDQSACAHSASRGDDSRLIRCCHFLKLTSMSKNDAAPPQRSCFDVDRMRCAEVDSPIFLEVAERHGGWLEQILGGDHDSGDEASDFRLSEAWLVFL